MDAEAKRLLRQLILHIHPDLFTNEQSQQACNTASLQVQLALVRPLSARMRLCLLSAFAGMPDTCHACPGAEQLRGRPDRKRAVHSNY